MESRGGVRMKSPTNPDLITGIQHLYKVIHSAGVDGKLLALVHLRTSQINGCSPCIHATVQAATKAGESAERLHHVVAWCETPFFTEEERAALALAEAVTRIQDGAPGVTDEIGDAAADHFTEEQLGAITLEISLTNLFNRLNHTVREQAGKTWRTGGWRPPADRGPPHLTLRGAASSYGMRTQITQEAPVKILVAGAGYAGTLAANRLAKKVPEAQITVVNPRPDFVERVRLHQQIAGTGKVTTPLAEMLHPGIRSRLAAVTKIGDGTATLDTGESVDFDHLVLAVGSTVTPLPGTVPVGTWEGAENARARLAALPAGAKVTVIGTGATGVETAAEVAEGRPDLDVRLVGNRLVASFSDGARRRVRAGLERLKVSVREDTVTEVGPDEVRLASGGVLACDLTLWGVLGTIPDLAARSGLDVDGSGRVLVDPYLRSVSDPRILAVGDCAAVPGSRAACQTAGPQGAHAADTLARLIRGREPRPYSMGYFGTGLSLGRSDGVIQLSRRDDGARRQYLAGRTAAVVKEGVTRGVRHGARTAAIVWLPGPK
ncbi:hypothetical protein GCM10010329_45180 [Streptomyces spiroverticillatus]|uniref:FAD/NAD(P)-binding domain-containing protein n=1 Tax=Streptomyces finlayi TaxID=67296 RepID=A0A919CBJ4_9ACTN|nr:FAD-dependent oxidoreductase [Streptomyces finlayi]GHA17104.1 hypothetical protein GCM10010329_45180 [Streptomyces spiroverticillatus]GHC99125.1 hypothetical protein GCM10010334_42350 [Streptomyces finlayi]